MSAGFEVEELGHYVEDEALQQIVGQMWDSYFGSVEPPYPAFDPIVADGPVVCATVTIAGPRAGLVSVAVPAALAPVLAGVMLQEDGEVGHEEVQDAFGEMANIVAGNVKALIPDAGSLGLPVLGSSVPRPQGSEEVARLDTAWRDGWLSFVVWLGHPSAGTGSDSGQERAR